MRKTAKRKRRPSRGRKRNAGNMFLRGFLQSFFIVAILLGAGVLGYRATMKLWGIENDETAAIYEAEPTPEPITEASIDDISKNLIYCYNQKKHKISRLVLEIFHCENKQLTYITIPMSTQFTMSDTLYRKLILAHPATPQLIRLSAMTGYFDSDTVFDYGVLIAEDLLGLDISYYTVIPQELYSTIFSEQYITSGTDEKERADEEDPSGKEGQTEEAAVPAEVFTKDYMKFLEGIETEKDLRAYIKEVYASIRSNLLVSDKMNYLESYIKTPLSNIAFERLEGKEQNSGFVIDRDKVRRRLQELTAYRQ